MNSLIDESIIRDILTGALGNFLSGILLALLGFIVLDQTKVRPWIYKYFRPIFIKMYQKILDFLFNTYLRISIFVFSLWMVNIGVNKLLFSGVGILVLLSFVFKQKYSKLEFPSSEFSDGFNRHVAK